MWNTLTSDSKGKGKDATVEAETEGGGYEDDEEFDPDSAILPPGSKRRRNKIDYSTVNCASDGADGQEDAWKGAELDKNTAEDDEGPDDDGKYTD